MTEGLQREVSHVGFFVSEIATEEVASSYLQTGITGDSVRV